MNGLLTQLKADHEELHRLWEVWIEEGFNVSIEEDLIERLSWLRQGLKVYKELSYGTIEGVVGGQLEGIENSVRGKEADLKAVAFPLSWKRKTVTFGDVEIMPRRSSIFVVVFLCSFAGLLLFF